MHIFVSKNLVFHFSSVLFGIFVERERKKGEKLFKEFRSNFKNR
jgi:hypothetical protein